MLARILRNDNSKTYVIKDLKIYVVRLVAAQYKVKYFQVTKHISNYKIQITTMKYANKLG